VEFDKPVDAKGNIEVWLQRLVDGMQDTVKANIKRAVRNVQVGGAAAAAVPVVFNTTKLADRTRCCLG
jgi:hypothetical protein